jgi:ribosomal-protein-alanine N-acetyltransferase
MVLFQTGRLTVQRFTAEDGDLFYRVNGSTEVMQFIRPVKNREASDTFLQENIRFYQDGSTLGRYAVFEKATGAFVGTFSFLYMSGEADFHLGYALLPEAWGNGYATELVRTGISYFFEKTDKPAVFAITVAENIASQQVLIKSGFSYKGQTEENGRTLELFYINREPVT